MSTKEPWNNEVYSAMKEELAEMKEHGRAKHESDSKLMVRFLTILVVLIFILAIGFILWNNQVRNIVSATKNSRQSSSVVKAEKSSSQAKVASSTESNKLVNTSTIASVSSSIQESWTTYKIRMGDYPSTIAAKTGVPWTKIARLNGITEAGYNADGSPIHAGQVLKLK
ncbi:LysM peptidoglycan-binding domain-containing protein [Lactococcus lactis]|jgi:LysM repeat protein|uniref:LysM repeat protein n=1 Tax=Lactococcus lactis TaxID=1358 RepID=A0AAW5TS53_9LACT|nr:SAG1386/EF1546 family surface-associated protein [Lactococcus lactis]MCT3092993.1 LysM peptidoglycan-binding domain-containing protein [Lactococcus lactis]MCW2281693.1 LysM repeat protein [Lactococcus lactis]